MLAEVQLKRQDLVGSVHHGGPRVEMMPSDWSGAPPQSQAGERLWEPSLLVSSGEVHEIERAVLGVVESQLVGERHVVVERQPTPVLLDQPPHLSDHHGGELLGERHGDQQFDDEQHDVQLVDGEQHDVQLVDGEQDGVQLVDGEPHDVQSADGERHDVQLDDEQHDVQLVDGEQHGELE